jgi:hypothetical protein
MVKDTSGTEQHARDRGSLNWSFAIRLALAVASVAAAVLLVTTAWPADLASNLFADAAYGCPTGDIGNALQLAQNFR